MDQPMVTMRHVRAAKVAGAGVLCASGVRAWCARHGVDYHALVRHGIPLDEAAAIEDAFAQRVCAIAREDARHG